MTRFKTLAAGVLLLTPVLGLTQELKTADEYRAALQDKFANPGNLTVERGAEKGHPLSGHLPLRSRTLPPMTRPAPSWVGS